MSMCKYLRFITITEEQRVPPLQSFFLDVLQPIVSTNIGDGLRPVHINFIHKAHAIFGTAIPIIDREVRQRQERLKYKILPTNNQSRSKPLGIHICLIASVVVPKGGGARWLFPLTSGGHTGAPFLPTSLTRG